jgi:mannosyltransferase OCH1-like enzyme
MRRCIPIYLTCVVIFLLILNADLFTVSIPRGNSQVLRRGSSRVKSSSPATAPVTPPGVGFPKKIWQSWKVDPLHFEQRDSNTARTWLQRNPDFRYEVLTDSNDLGYVEQHFGPGGFDRPDIVNLYRDINATIIKADLLRYMVMYAEGGVYADIDVEALKPVSKFIPDHRYAEDDIDMVIGVEVDEPEFKDHPILGKKSRSFCQWTFMARPRLPVMMRLIENIMSWLSDLARQQNVPISEVVMDFDQVISGTGPSAFTAAILEEMNANRPIGTPEITWDVFHDLDESKIVSRVLVLDVEAFAAGQGHSDSGNHNARGALVKHHYHASNWPSRHPRFTHPVYGPVEHCNWEASCVRQWDADTAAYALMTPEEQKALAEEKEAERKATTAQQEEFLARIAQQQEALKQPLHLGFGQQPLQPLAPPPAKPEAEPEAKAEQPE